jgi:membrane protein implicated in regulation of membrane protease activity
MAPDEAVVGCTGKLVIATRGAEGPGEALVRVRGGSETFLAWSDEPLERGATVLVIESRGTRQVVVMAWSDPSLDEWADGSGDTGDAR